MQTEPVKRYLSSESKMPYFLFVGDERYTDVLDELRAYGLDFVSISNFCSSDDKVPDIDELFRYIEVSDVNANGKKFVVTGLGEYLALCGFEDATRTLSRAKDYNTGGSKVVLCLRGLTQLVAGLQADTRFDNRRYGIIENTECNLSFTLVDSCVGLSALNGIKAILSSLENGQTGSMVINTAINLNNSLFPVRRIDNAYEGVMHVVRGVALERAYGTDSQWSQLLSELIEANNLLQSVFEKHSFDATLNSNIYVYASGDNYVDWLCFIYLKINADVLGNSYMRFVLDRTDRFENLSKNILNVIIDVPHTDKRFDLFYRERKLLVEKFPESDIASFIVNNRKDVSESVYKLTDNTRVEREEIIAWVSKNGMIPQLDTIYPALVLYATPYVFKSSTLANLLTDYFEKYKQQKITNQLDPTFLDEVDELALTRKFNQLPSRESVIENIDKEGTLLYWLDALGVEYLGLIESLANRRGLAISVSIVRAKLPTITTINRDFYDLWKGAKDTNKELDNVKHNDDGGYNFTNNEQPIHLAKEIDILINVMDRAATDLAYRRCKRFIIASDHGASRLAVLRKKEEKYDTDTAGEHSGRCCKLFQPYDLPFAAEENGYIILADYGRFKKSRAANVEVHGGASLEEVVIPVVELSLKDDSVTVKLVNETVTADYTDGAAIELFFNAPVKDVSVIIDGQKFSAVRMDDNHYSVKLSIVRRAGVYHADVYSGDNLVGGIEIAAQGKGAKVNDAFDNLF